MSWFRRHGDTPPRLRPGSPAGARRHPHSRGTTRGYGRVHVSRANHRSTAHARFRRLQRRLAPLRGPTRPEAAAREARRMAGTYVPPADHTDEHPRAEDLTGSVHGRGAYAGPRSAREAQQRKDMPGRSQRIGDGHLRTGQIPPSLSDETTRSTGALMPSDPATKNSW